MHFHLPKPLHGWRAFAGEVAIIVLGVLIALGAEQIVERVSWGVRVSDARADLSSELEETLTSAQERLIYKDCVTGQLSRVDALIENPPAQPWTVEINGPIRLWSTAAWDSAIASGAVAHMGSRQRADYAEIYGVVRTLRDVNLEEFKVKAELSMLDRGGALSEASRDRLHADVARLRAYNMLMIEGAAPLRDLITRAGVRIDAEHRQELVSEKCLSVGPSLNR